jgi:hypothetical protein
MQRKMSSIRVVAVAVATSLAGACATPVPPLAAPLQYVNVPASEYQEAPETIARWAQGFDDAAIAKHGFRIWAAITADSG